mgnify:FL=1
MRISLLSIEGKTYPLVFSLNAAEQIEDEYIPVTKMVDCLLEPEKFKKNSISLVKDIVYIMMCEGIRYCARKEIRQQDGKELILDIPDKESLYEDIGYEDSGILTEAMYSTLVKSKKKESTTK